MAFNKEQVNQLEYMFNKQRSLLALDTKSIVQGELVEVNEKIDRVIAMETGDVQVAYKDINMLKKVVKRHDLRITALER